MLQIDHSKKLSVYARISYDAVNKRIRLAEYVDIKKGPTKFYELIFLYNEVKSKTPGVEFRCDMYSLPAIVKDSKNQVLCASQ